MKATPTKQAPALRELPEDVLQLLAQQHKAKTQAAIAAELGISTSAVNQALKNRFRGNVERLCARVRGQYGGDTVHCPVLGLINTKVCLDQQTKSAVFSNPVRVALARACKVCQHRQQPATTTGGSDHE